VSTTMERAERLAALLAERELDALLVTNLVNVRWLTGFTGSNGLALVGVGGAGSHRLFLTDFRYLTQSAEQLDAGWRREIAPEILPAATKALGAGHRSTLRLGFDDASMSVKDHATLTGRLAEGVELVAAGGAVEQLRAVKDAGELDKIRAAAMLADAALTEVLGRGLVGRTERDVALDLEVTMRKAGAEAASFAPIVAAGAPSSTATPRTARGPTRPVSWTRATARSTSWCSALRRPRWPRCAPVPAGARSTPSPARSSPPLVTASTSATASAMG
jgi:Xaa-Pro aminopeptidase